MDKFEIQANKLFYERSPYLLQHAYNPVRWYPWGNEAFRLAKEQEKPVFLSIGYAACHWCHVMEKESFSDPGIAGILNENFIAVKVDREERPDIDRVYLEAVTAMTGSAGWPLSVFLTPDLVPFYGGTYFPPEDRGGQKGFAGVLTFLAGMWKNERERILKCGGELVRLIRSETGKPAGAGLPLDVQLLDRAFENSMAARDPSFGGFGGAPKFYQCQTLSFLLRYWARTKKPEALAMVEKTLQAIAAGGVCDVLGGGFHRYSVDREWRVPHFEKMLYDQALLSKLYVEAYQATGNVFYAVEARKIFDYVLRDMTGEFGYFYSAEDADSLDPASEKRRRTEGAFYVWTEEEISAVLGTEKAKMFCFRYSVSGEGNVPGKDSPEFLRKNILRAARTIEETALQFGLSAQEAAALLEECRKSLLAVRENRARPLRDEKVLMDWNALMIESLALASRVFSDERYRRAAMGAADFILARMKRKDGRRMHCWIDGETKVAGFLEDYAFFTQALLGLYEATFQALYLEEAKALMKEIHCLFRDAGGEGFFQSGSDAESLFFRPKEFCDGAIPSGNGVSILTLLRLSRITGEREHRDSAEAMLCELARSMERYPLAYSQALIALDQYLGPCVEIVLAGGDEEEMREMLAAVYEPFLPNKAVFYRNPEGEERRRIETVAPFIKDCLSLKGLPTAFVCKNGVCQLPTDELFRLKQLLQQQDF